MAYTPYYTANFNNEKDQLVEITIYKQDGDPVDIINFPVTEFKLTDNGETQEKDNWIVIRRLDLGLWIEAGSPVTWESFLADDHDDWKVYVAIDGQPWFEGFIMPDQGEAPFLDPPYEITIRATNGLSLLKNSTITAIDGSALSGDSQLIEYIAAALKKTGLSLPIRVYCSYLNTSMLNKGNGLQYDMFNQSYLDYRTFKKDAVTFNSCYEVLEAILKGFCVLEYWNGMWQITCLADRQYLAGDRFYVDYDSNGANPIGHKDTDNYAQIGKNVDIYPIEEDAVISGDYAVNSVKTSYSYNVVPSLYNNEGLNQLGTQTDTGDILDTDDEDHDGDTSEVIGHYFNHELVGWVHKKQFLNEVDPISNAYIRVNKDLYDKETARYYVVERDATAPVDPQTLNYIRPSNIDFYVKKGDKIDVSITGRLNADINEIWGACSILVYIGGDPSDNNNYWFLDPFGQFRNLPGGATSSGWAQFSGSDLDLSEWQTASLDNCTIPADGILIIKLTDGFGPGAATEAHFKDLRITYKIFIGGSYFSATGDFWFRSQNKTYPNIIDESVQISDSPRRIAKGALIFKNDTVDTLTNPTWYSFYQIGNPNPTGESKDFKELINLAWFNQRWRRMYSVEGSFDGLTMSAENNQMTKLPIGFYKSYRFVDMASVHDFVLVPPLEYDIGRGQIRAHFVEVSKGPEDGTQTGDNEKFDYTFQ